MTRDVDGHLLPSLDERWCYFDLPFFRGEAEHETPERFARRGVLIRPVELERV